MCFIIRTHGILLNTGFLDLQLGLCNPDIEEKSLGMFMVTFLR